MQKTPNRIILAEHSEVLNSLFLSQRFSHPTRTRARIRRGDISIFIKTFRNAILWIR